jgi:hypothetical protein
LNHWNKRPVEFYGKWANEQTKDQFQATLAREQCPFLKRRCVKIRKSNPSQTIGACTVGFQDGPLIICPHRFVQDNRIFLDALYLLKPNLEYYVVPEITMPGGNIDYFLVGLESLSVVDYAGIEIQSLDTTGSGGIWKARQDLAQRRFSDTYAYGINWKMSAKTILVQMHHKAEAFEQLGKKLVLVVQKKFFDYVSTEFRTDQLRDAKGTDSVHVHVYDLVPLQSQLRLELKEKKSTDVHGVERMLTLGREGAIRENDVVDRIRAKMSNAIRLEKSN